jgi:hypothetical protein
MGRFFHGKDKRQPDLIKLRALPSGALGFPRVAGLRVRSAHLPIPSDRNHGVTGSGGQRHPDSNSDENKSCAGQRRMCRRAIRMVVGVRSTDAAGLERIVRPRWTRKARLPQAGIGFRPEVRGRGTAVLASLRSRLEMLL